MTYNLEKFLQNLEEKNPGEKEFLQSAEEVLETIIPFINENPKYQNKAILERMVEPERIITFRVPWLDDNGNIQVNRAFRVEFNSAIGPYKGGLRFHKSVNLSILKFLGFEQTFKNSLTTLPMGGGKGGSDFDPKGKSDNEVMKFCQSFMSELYRHIGANTDIPAGDIGVGAREIGFLFGQYKKLKNEFVGILTGKGLEFGGSLIRPEATGYGLVYFMKNMLEVKNDNLENKKILISGSGNVSQYAVEKLIELGAKVLTMSDSSGTIYDSEGIDKEKLEYIKKIKNIDRKRISTYLKDFPKAVFLKGERPWNIKAHIAFPCATQNEIEENDAENLVKNGVFAIGEGANMPSTPKAIEIIKNNNILFSPAKASNAGGVAVSGLEMSQNSLRYNWTREEVDNKLIQIMEDIHNSCVKYGKKENGEIDYISGANIAGFVKVADAMLAQGVV
ncbi:MAG: NADP-specific glutamate dehydrogenase [Candidatus Gracilibacteria bacterium]|nr:NADP-specific glutamate dehydrogenase [Candidatus Gracilibacteria bacterium]